jgi:hypothetical protein
MHRLTIFFFALTAGQVGTPYAGAPRAWMRRPSLRHGSTLRALRGFDPLGRAASVHG